MSTAVAQRVAEHRARARANKVQFTVALEEDLLINKLLSVYLLDNSQIGDRRAIEAALTRLIEILMTEME